MTNYSRSVLKSNGLPRPKIRLKKFGFSSKSVPANIVKKLPSQRCSKPLLIPFFNFSHKWPTFAFTPESGYTLGFRRKIAHSGSQGETGVFRMGALSLPSERSARSQTSPGRVSERRTLPLLGLDQVYSRRTQKAFGTAMRLCASRPRWAALPAASMHSACFSGMERLDQAFRQSYYHTQLTERAAVWRLCGNRFGR